MPEVPKMMTINQLSQEYSLPKNFIRNLVLQNKIHYVKAGKKYLVNVNLFVEYLNSKKL